MTPPDTTSDPTPADDVRERLRHPEVRNYLVAVLAALVCVAGVLLGRGSDVGALLVGSLGAAGVVLRWAAAPAFVVVLTTYFVLFPTGVPQLGYGDPWATRHGHFHIADVILTAATVVYVAGQYRLFGVLAQALPSETGAKPRPGTAVRRPPAAIAAGEVTGLFAAAAWAVVAGQLAWWLLTTVRVEPGRPFPLAFVAAAPTRGNDRLSDPGSRFVLLAGAAFAAAVAARLFFGYRRLTALTRDEARLIVQEAEWDETRRELSRLEHWRAWAAKRAAGRKRKGGRP